MVRLVAVCAFIIAAFITFGSGSDITHPPGEQQAPATPLQINLDSAPAITLGDFRLQPRASFTLRARVLSREDYRFDRGAEISPVDLALGWGPMSDTAVLDQISISQRNRWYYWQTPQFPIPRRDIETHSANMHMIPADGDVKDSLAQVRQGQVVEIRGYLVDASASDGFRWRSSLSREDTGNGACELVYVESITLM